MLSLSPAKLLVILVIALIVLGPEKLPQVARQIGAAWHDLRAWRSRIESEVRGTFPNLPPTHEVAQAVRSPLAFLDRLADDHERTLSEQQPEGPGTEGSGSDESAGIGPGPPLDNGNAPAHGPGTDGSGTTHGVGSSNGAAANGAGAATSPGVHNGPVGANVLPAVPDDPSMN